MIRSLRLPPQQVEAITQHETKELERRQHLYRGDRGVPDIRGNTVILVDDGMATGYTMRVAVTALRHQEPLEIIVAVPVASSEACREVAREANSVVCLSTPQDFYAVGGWYRNFSQVSDAEVRELLERAESQPGLSPS
jgi:putative phosphoribosyl transferase